MTERRVSERERERAVERLKPRLVDGSLSTDTFGVRVESAYSARTRSELADLFADLPGLRARLAGAWQRALDRIAGPKEEPVVELRLPDTTSPVILSIGRADDCDFVVDEPTVSRHHATLRRTPEGWRLRDVSSTNGTRLNGWRVEDAALHPGDELMLGLGRFWVRG